MPSEPPILVAIDTERATAEGAPHLVELAGVRFRGSEELDHFATLVSPEVPVQPETTLVHGLDDDALRDAPRAPDALERFAAWAGDDPLVAHDARAEGFALGFEHARHGLRPPAGPLLDSLALARRAFPALEDHRLAALAEHLGLETEGMHRALPDAALAWQVTDAAAAELGGWEALCLPRLLELCGARAIAAYAPGRPNRRPALVRALERAARGGSPTRLVYGAGDAPAFVVVLPRWVYRVRERSYLEAETASGELRTFRLDRIQKLVRG